MLGIHGYGYPSTMGVGKVSCHRYGYEEIFVPIDYMAICMVNCSTVPIYYSLPSLIELVYILWYVDKHQTQHIPSTLPLMARSMNPLHTTITLSVLLLIFLG
jgi:hypothetical protein